MKIKPLKWQPYIPFTNVTVHYDICRRALFKYDKKFNR